MLWGQGRWWGLAACVAWAGSAWLPGIASPWLAPLTAAWCLALGLGLRRRGATLAGPAVAAAALALTGASVVGQPPPAPALRSPDLLLPRAQRPIQRLRLLDAPQPAAFGWRTTATWLSSCQPGPAGACHARHGRLAVTLPREAATWGPGTQLRLLGFVRPPPGYAGPGADTIRTRWRRQGLRGGVRALTPQRLAVEGAPAPLGWWAGHRLRLRSAMMRVVPGKSGGLLRALALGDRSGVARSHLRALRRTGTAHVLAVSGTHVGFVLLMVLALLRALLRWPPCSALLRRWPLAMWELALGALATVAYTGLTGAAPSTRRAAVVAVAALLIRAAGTRPAAVELLGAAALCALWVDPNAAHDAGLALSLLGAWGALTGARLPLPGGAVLRAFVVSAAAWASTAVASVPLFGQLPVLAPLVNLIVVPFAGVVLLPLALLTLLAALSQTLFGAEVLPSAVLTPLRWGARWAVTPIDAMAAVQGWPCLDVGGVDAWLIGGGLGAALLLLRSERRHRSVIAIGLCAVIVAAVAIRPTLSRPASGTVDVRFLDVGHGDCALLRFADGTTMLVDAGGEVGDDGRVGRAAVLPVLRALGIRRIDHMVLTHAHPDHENGLLAVARAMPVGTFWFNNLGNRSHEHRALLQALSKWGARWRRRWSGQIGGVAIKTLWPPPAGPIKTMGLNDNSLVIEVSTTGGRLLLAGDVERHAEARLVSSGRLRPCDVLKVPHHGSRTSSTPAFLDQVQPRVAVAGARSWGQLPFPHADVSARYARRHVPLLRTERGLVRVLLTPTAVRVWQAAATMALPARRR